MITTRENLAIQLQHINAKVGFTSGSFDLVHSTHIEVFKEANELCDILIVGVNSDQSIKEYKGPSRPIRNQADRIKLIDAIKYVDFCFLFDEKNNTKNIEILKPNLYIKGGDYKVSQLSSNELVKKYGGETIILDTPTNISTSSIINKIKSEPVECTYFNKYKGIVFIDRDGVINEEVNYLKDEKDFKFIDGTIEAIQLLNKANYAVVVITNQPGIGVGLYSKEDFFNINRKMISELHKNKAHVDKVYFCPDMNKDSIFKKPNAGMLYKAFSDFNMNINIDGWNSWIIGDRQSDAATSKGILKTIGVLTGYALKDDWNNCKPMYIADNLLDAVKNIITKEHNGN